MPSRSAVARNLAFALFVLFSAEVPIDLEGDEASAACFLGSHNSDNALHCRAKRCLDGAGKEAL